VEISFPGGLRVDAVDGGFRVRTDQPLAQGGEGTAPSPFDLFLAALGTCSGYYALRFCQQRNLDTDGLGLSVAFERDAADKRVALVRVGITLPPTFPERYREALLRAVGQCTVKRHLEQPPRFEITAAPAPVAAAVREE